MSNALKRSLQPILDHMPHGYKHDVLIAYRRTRLALGRALHWRAERALRASGCFDGRWYLDRYPDVAAAGADPLQHYLRFGAFEGRMPNPVFDGDWYLRKNPDVAAAGMNPLYHYLAHGEAEARAPNRDTDLPALAKQLKVKAGGGRVLRRLLVEHAEGRAARTSSASEVSSKPASARLREAAEQVGQAVSKRLAPATAPVFRDFTEFERVAPFIGGLHSPFSEEAKRVLGHMHARRRYWLRLADGDVDRGLPDLVSMDLEGVFSRGDLQDPPSPKEKLAATMEEGDSDWLLLSQQGCLLHPEAEPVLRAAIQGNPWADLVHFAWLDLTGVADARSRWSELITNASGWDEPGQVLEYCWHSPALSENRLRVPAGFMAVRRAFLEGLLPNMPPLGCPTELAELLLQEARVLSLPCLLGACVRDALAGAHKGSRGALATHHKLSLAAHLPENGALPGVEQMYLRSAVRPVAESETEETTDRPCTVIIPSFECEDYLKLCLESVFAFSPTATNVIVVDNGSSASLQQWLSQAPERYGTNRLHVIQNEKNLGFTYAVNQGIRKASPGSDVVLLNNDAVVTPGWLHAMQRVLDEVEGVGLVVPRQTLLARTKTMLVHNPMADDTRELDVNLSLHHGNVLDPSCHAEHGYIELRFAPFFCVYIPHATLDCVGALDYECGPHYRSDQLYCEAVRRIAEKRIIYTPHSKLYHFLQRATASLRTKDSDGFQRMFVRNSWGDIAEGEARS